MLTVNSHTRQFPIVTSDGAELQATLQPVLLQYQWHNCIWQHRQASAGSLAAFSTTHMSGAGTQPLQQPTPPWKLKTLAAGGTTHLFDDVADTAAQPQLNALVFVIKPCLSLLLHITKQTSTFPAYSQVIHQLHTCLSVLSCPLALFCAELDCMWGKASKEHCAQLNNKTVTLLCTVLIQG